MKLSQSFLKRYLDATYCRHAIKLEYIDKVPTVPTDAMLKGKVFEYKLIGATRHSDEIPELPKLQSGKPSADEKRLDELVANGHQVMKDLGIEIIEVQPEWEHDGFHGHPDIRAAVRSEGLDDAVIDIKYTETKLDDRWSGWADIEENGKNHFQALAYTWLSERVVGEPLPFFFLIFGKSGWVRFIRIRVMPESMAHFLTTVGDTAAAVEEEDWLPIDDYNVCRGCQFFDICDKKTTVPQTEIVTI